MSLSAPGDTERYQSNRYGTWLLQSPECPVTIPARQRRGLRNWSTQVGLAVGHITQESWHPGHLGLPTPWYSVSEGVSSPVLVAEQLSGAATCQQQCPEWPQSLQSPQRMSSALAERICLYEGTLESWWKEVLALLSRAVREAVSVSGAATDLCISALFIFLHSLQGKHRGRQRNPCVLQDHRRRCNHPQLQKMPLNFPKPKFHFLWRWYITNTTDRPTLCSVCMPVCIYIYI